MVQTQRKLLIICGPTATGKTKLATQIAADKESVLISADSRQVYKGMDIGTGKDHPKKVKLYGIDLVTPNQQYTVAQYFEYVSTLINKAHSQKKLPILVGGTGLYMKAIVGNLADISIPPNPALRKRLKNKSAQELLDMLRKLDSARAENLNNSDSNNPRRLIRYIEIASGPKPDKPKKVKSYDLLWIGLTASQDKLDKLIDKRVLKRANKDFGREVKMLQNEGYTERLKTTIGYKQWLRYLDGDIDIQKAVEDWKMAEYAYARRQLTWFKKEPRVNWFDVSEPSHRQKVEKLVSAWYK